MASAEKVSETPALDIIRTFLTAAAFLLMPPVFDSLFAMGSLFVSEKKALMLGAAGLAVFVALLPRLARRRPRVWRAVSAVAALFLAFEFGSRGIVNTYFPEHREFLARLSTRTYEEFQTFIGHPFLIYTGNPAVGYSRLGFNSGNVEAKKPEGVVRFACLGSSTTEDSYPYFTQLALNEAIAARGLAAPYFEALNFGLTGYTSAQSLVNFALNVQDFSPDFVVLFDGFSEITIRGDRPGFRNDYAHIMQAFTPRPSYDRYLLRMSVPYRALKDYYEHLDEWLIAYRSAYRDLRWTFPRQDGLDLEPFRRNTRTLIDLALARGVRPVLLSVPYSTDPGVPYFALYLPHMKLVNAIIGEIARDFGERIHYVDLDAEMTGKNAMFTDMVHMTPAGVKQKAEKVASAILADYDLKALRSSTIPATQEAAKQ